MTSFCRFDLRTTDADAARAFYAKILGHDRAAIWPLHEQALARGARPHWLGRLGVENVELASEAFVARGATRLGPTISTIDRGEYAVLRDPGGALVALGTSLPAIAETRVDVSWHVLNTNDVARAIADYHELFGWEVFDRTELGTNGPLRPFAWHAGGATLGAFADIAERPGVHPHWLFFFDVDALDPAIAAARAAGGLVLEPTVMPSGERACVCDDPQGAAFALRERRPSP